MVKKEISKEQSEVYIIENMLEDAIFPPTNANIIPNKKELDAKILALLPKLQKEVNCILSRSELAILYGLPILLGNHEVEEQILESIKKRNQSADISKLLGDEDPWVGFLSLNNLSDPQGVILPKAINGTLVLRSLQKLEGMKLPEKIDGKLWLGGLDNESRKELISQRPDLAVKIFPNP